MDNSVENDPLFVKSVEKAISVLEAFSDGQASLSLNELVQITGLDKSGAQRFTHTLTRLGYLKKNESSRRYELAPRTLELGSNYIRANELIRVAQPHLLNLSRLTEESVSLTVLDDCDVVYTYRLLSRNMLNTDVITGTRLPAYCTAPGIAMLSALPHEEAEDILARSNRVALTASTTWELPKLHEKLQTCRSLGYATAIGEIYQNDISIAAAIIGHKGRPIAAVTIAVSGLRFTAQEAEQRMAPLVVSVAESLSQSKPQHKNAKL